MTTFKYHLGTMLVALVCLSSAAQGIQIQLDYSLDTLGFFTDTARRDVMQAAVDYFEPYLTDDLLAIEPGGVNRWDAGLWHPATGVWHEESGLNVPADTLILFVGGRDLDGGAIGQAGPGGYSASGRTSFLNAVTTRGEGTTSGTSATDFGPWGGSAAFDTEINWYFNSDTSTNEAFSGYDFYSVALHEMGHVLGFGTSDSWDNLVAGSDPYTFTGSASAGMYGTDVPLAAEAHWYYGTRSEIGGVGSFEASMDPNIASGQRKRMTDLDMAALDDIGWDVIYEVAVPRLGDFDGDGDIDADDIDLLGAAIRTGSTDLLYDMDGDGGVDVDDFDVHVTVLVDTSLGLSTGTEYGDWNLDGLIDLLDVATLGDGYGAFDAGWADGNGNVYADTEVDLLDLAAVGDNYGYVGTVIPEPATISVMVVGALALLRRRKR